VYHTSKAITTAGVDLQVLLTTPHRVDPVVVIRDCKYEILLAWTF